MATPTALSDPEALSDFHPGAKRPASLLARSRGNLTFRSVWSELNGAMGDLGTYIPIVLSLSLSRHLDLGTTLIFTGIYNAVTGLVYGVPMPVQPMKSIAAAALSDPSFDIPEIMAAGILTAAFVLLLGVTCLMKLVYWFVPLPVVRGIQLAQGLNFAMAAVKYIRYEQDLGKGKSWRRRWASAIPSAVIVFVLGVVFAIIRHPAAVKELRVGPSRMRVVHIPTEAWKQGFIKGAVPQIPLSVLNSVVAVCKLTRDLFPEKED
ncbi:hypothetical protein ACQ4PT_029189 [Festuca glaucescens]